PLLCAQPSRGPGLAQPVLRERSVRRHAVECRHRRLVALSALAKYWRPLCVKGRCDLGGIRAWYLHNVGEADPDLQEAHVVLTDVFHGIVVTPCTRLRLRAASTTAKPFALMRICQTVALDRSA